jgi:broad specificity phosphatase PhoE
MVAADHDACAAPAPGWARDAFAEILLARHGETEGNAQGRRQGRLDSPLTETGWAQTSRTAQLVSLRVVDGIFASPLGRCRTTAGVFATQLGLVMTVVEDLAEVDHGVMAGLTDTEMHARYPDEVASRTRHRYRYRFPGGESYADADQRAAYALRRIAGHAKRPLIVSHEMIGRMLLRHLLALTPAQALAWSHPHDVVYRVRVDQPSCEALRA